MERLQELVEGFALFDDWEERYAYLIDLGKTLPGMDEALKTDERIVRGCTSRVWLDTTSSVNTGGKTVYHFTADSDAMIVRGLIAILMAAFNDCTGEEIAQIDIEGAFNEMGLSTHLSPNRRNGFFAMVGRIKAETAA